jgi:uncharacterized protein
MEGVLETKPLSLQEQLHSLYLLDQQVRGLRSRLDAARRRQRALETKRDQLQQQQAELAQQLKQAQASAASLEHQAADVDQRIEQLRQQMNSVRSNKEYSALLVEVNTLKQAKSEHEDGALEKMSEVDALKARLAEIETRAADQQKMVDRAAAEADQARAEVGDRLDDATAERDAAAAEVPAEARQLFERLVEMHDGEALAPVDEVDRRRMEYNCGGCYMSLPIEHVNSIMAKPNAPTTCPSCGRILYLGQELKAALAPKG